MSKDDDTAGLRIRSAVRALLVDPDERVLLVRFEFPTATVWAMPGGGIEPGETDHDALHRELAEELGLVGATIGPHVWSRLHIVPFVDGSFDGQRDRIYLVRAAAFEPTPHLTWAQLRAERVHELRWWTRAEIATAGAERTVRFAPRRLAELLDELLSTGPPTTPIDTGV